MTELRIAVGTIRTFLGLPVALQAVVLVAQKLCYFFMTDRMLLPSQPSSQIPGAFADPAQGIFGIAPRFRFNEAIQRHEKPGIALHDPLPTRAGPANTSRHYVSFRDLAYSQGNGFS
jgi:hypothetical protein